MSRRDLYDSGYLESHMAVSSWVTSKGEVKRIVGSEKSRLNRSFLVLSRLHPSSDPQLAHL